MTRDAVLGLWALLAACSALYVAVSFTNPRLATVPEVLRRLTTRRWRMLTGFVVWMWLGWHFFAR